VTEGGEGVGAVGHRETIHTLRSRKLVPKTSIFDHMSHLIFGRKLENVVFAPHNLTYGCNTGGFQISHFFGLFFKILSVKKM
jgi:hypothetical protein